MPNKSVPGAFGDCQVMEGIQYDVIKSQTLKRRFNGTKNGLPGTNKRYRKKKNGLCGTKNGIPVSYTHLTLPTILRV